MANKLRSLILVTGFTVGIFLFAACKKDAQINPPVVKPIEVTPPVITITDNIYPNPCNGTFTIQTNTTDSQNVVMYNLIGNKVLNLTINGTTAIVDNSLTNGIYILEITTKTGVKKERLVVQR